MNSTSASGNFPWKMKHWQNIGISTIYCTWHVVQTILSVQQCIIITSVTDLPHLPGIWHVSGGSQESFPYMTDEPNRRQSQMSCKAKSEKVRFHNPITGCRINIHLDYELIKFSKWTSWKNKFCSRYQLQCTSLYTVFSPENSQQLYFFWPSSLSTLKMQIICGG